ncbi:MAG: glycosyltransferase [Fibrobacter intestinalis]|uniref:glycosyltransferase n=1 Tax=Fibrobacter intestinalis TaxID=28122 RepID=UPI003F0DAC08
MRILHYFLGFPPYRSGGLTKFAFDLMQGQVDEGHKVSALWPGQMNFFFKGLKIRQKKSICGIANYELVNPLPVPLLDGIANVYAYTAPKKTTFFAAFLKHIKPQIIHVHTLMGLPKEFLEIAKTLEIRTVFTSHDYFGLCPRATFFRNNKFCEEDNHCKDCVSCNAQALSITKIVLLQSRLYKTLKDCWIVKKMRNNYKAKISHKQQDDAKIKTWLNSKKYADDYIKLRSYYLQMLSLIDIFHFNSNLTKSIYEKYLRPRFSKVISITHKNIQDNRRLALEKKTSVNLRLTYLGSVVSYKGFFVLKQALDELWENGFKNFELRLFGGINKQAPYMRCEGEKYDYRELKNIFKNTDILLAPSLCPETFGFTVLEALSHGVPVIVSENVGAKDIAKDVGLIVKTGSVEGLKNAILEMSNNLDLYSGKVQSDCAIKSWNSFLREMENLYRN